MILRYSLYIQHFIHFNLYIISAKAKSKLNGRQRRGRGQQSNLTLWLWTVCVHAQACGLQMSLISADSTREFLTFGSHAFSWGLSQAASGYIYDSPSSQTTTPPPTPRYSHIDNLDSSICCCCNFSEIAAFGGSDSSRRRQWGITPSGHILERFNTGALISRMAERLQRSTREVCHFLAWNVRKIIGEKKEKKSMWHFCLRSNSTWAAYRPRQHLEWDEDWKKEG